MWVRGGVFGVWECVDVRCSFAVRRRDVRDCAAWSCRARVCVQVVAGALVAPSTVEASLSGSVLTLSNIVLPAAAPARLFLLPYTQA